MSRVNLIVFAAKFFALGVFLTAEVVWWRDALRGPPSKRRVRVAVAILGLILLLITVYAILFR
jgi:hypothetical protein